MEIKNLAKTETSFVKPNVVEEVFLDVKRMKKENDIQALERVFIEKFTDKCRSIGLKAPQITQLSREKLSVLGDMLALRNRFRYQIKKIIWWCMAPLGIFVPVFTAVGAARSDGLALGVMAFLFIGFVCLILGANLYEATSGKEDLSWLHAKLKELKGDDYFPYEKIKR